MLLQFRPKTQPDVPSLENPFAVEASSATLELIEETVSSLLPEITVEPTPGATQRSLTRKESVTISLLRLLKAVLMRLVVAHVDPACVGITGDDGEGAIARVHRLLEKLMEGSYHTAIQVEAVITLDIGLDVLYPDARRRADLLRSLIEKHQQNPMAPDSSPYLLLVKLLERFSSATGAVALLPTRGEGSGDGEENEGQARQITASIG